MVSACLRSKRDCKSGSFVHAKHSLKSVQAGLRNKPMYNPTHYSVEWATVVTGYIRKLLMEIALPTAPRPGLNVKFTFKSVLADPASRKKWLDRFKYW